MDGPLTERTIRVDETADARIRVEVILKGALADQVPGGRAAIELPAGALAEAILAAFDLPVAPCIYAINGVAGRGTAPLQDGDRVVVYPPMAGG